MTEEGVVSMGKVALWGCVWVFYALLDYPPMRVKGIFISVCGDRNVGTC